VSDLRFPGRVAGLRALLEREAVAGIFVSDLENVRYLTGFTGSNGLVLVTHEAAIFWTDGRYGVQSAREVPGFERIVLLPGSKLAEAAGARLRGIAARQIAFEEAHLTVRALHEMEAAMPDNVRLVGKSDLVESLRQRKDAEEIAAVRRATALADAAFDHVREIARPGVTERELAWEIEAFLRRSGATRLSFETIVASGPNSALPHARPTGRRLGEGGCSEFVIFDFGAEVDGYCSDITRTLVVGGAPTERQRDVYAAVLRTQQGALAAIAPGRPGKQIDQLARDLLGEAGLAERFTHGLGHALGRVCHDGPALSQTSTVTLAPGMVLTVEPGVYLEGWGGVRIEDDVLVTPTGCEILTRSAKELIVVG